MVDSSFRVILDQKGEFEHFFGHDPQLRGLNADGGTKPAHLVLSLDTSDPRLAQFGFDVGPTLRLVHPYFYSQGQTFAYTHGSGEIIFTKPFESRLLDPQWPAENYPQTFPRHAVDLTPGTPVADDWLFETIYISKILPTQQDESGMRCEACGDASVQLFAIIPSTPLPDLHLWGFFGEGVTTNFWYCSACHAISTRNSSD